MSLDPKKWPELKKAWDAYGHAVPFEDLVDARTDSRGCYVVVCWRSYEGNLTLADLARAGTREPWEFQNDEIGPDITDAEWRKLRIEPECDNFYIPGHAEFRPWG